jgi:flagellar assembly protein FliH
LSNLIRSQQPAALNKKIIGTRKIETKPLTIFGNDIDPGQQKYALQQEISALQTQHSELQRQLQEQREQALAEIVVLQQNARQQAEAEAERLAEEASRSGYETGLAQGIQQAEDEFRQAREDMQLLIETAYQEKAKIVQDAEPFLVSLSVRIAEKVLKNELKQHDSQLLTIVQRALKRVEEAEDVVMQVSLEDYPILLPFLGELKTYIRADSELKLVPVLNLSKGGCMIHTASGSYDVTVDSQLKEIKRQLLAYCEEKTDH